MTYTLDLKDSLIRKMGRENPKSQKGKEFAKLLETLQSLSLTNLDYKEFTNIIDGFRINTTNEMLRLFAKALLLAVGFKKLIQQEFTEELSFLFKFLPSHYFLLQNSDRCQILHELRNSDSFMSQAARVQDKALLKNFFLKSVGEEQALVHRLKGSRLKLFLMTPLELEAVRRQIFQILRRVSASRQPEANVALPVADISATTIFNPSKDQDINEMLEEFRCSFTSSVIVGEVTQEIGTNGEPIYYSKQALEDWGKSCQSNSHDPTSPITRRHFKDCQLSDATGSYRQRVLTALNEILSDLSKVNAFAKELKWPELKPTNDLEAPAPQVRPASPRFGESS